MAVLWVVAPCRLVEVTHRPDDGGSKHLRNVCKLLLDYTAQQPRRQSIEMSFLRAVMEYGMTGHKVMNLLETYCGRALSVQ
jgi:hypothetical protein